MTEIEEVKLYGRFDDIRASIVSINITNISPDRIVAPFLENVKGIITRAGLHCSPWCHKALGTFPNGTVRISPGFFNSVEDIDVLISSIKQLSQQKDYHVIG